MRPLICGFLLSHTFLVRLTADFSKLQPIKMWDIVCGKGGGREGGKGDKNAVQSHIK